jgi:DNA-binding winged helix-turn-helix (wHTH) protein
MQQQTQGFYIFGPFHLDAGNRLLLRAGEPVPLTLKAVETLLVLVENAGRVVTKDELMRSVWPDTFVEEGNLAKNVFALRKALGDADDGREYIETLPKRGYLFRVAVSAPPASAANLSGRKVSHYRVLQILGAGSMGVVYSAEDLKLGRRAR